MTTTAAVLLGIASTFTALTIFGSTSSDASPDQIRYQIRPSAASTSAKNRPEMNFTKTVVVLGSAYGGPRAAQILAAGVPKGWRVLLIDRNSHSNNVYIFPRLSVLPGHEHKAFIPNTNVFRLDTSSHPHLRLQATVTSIAKDTLTLSKTFPEHDLPSATIPYDYMIYALGSHMPTPLNLWALDKYGKYVPPKPVGGRQLPVYRGMKPEGIAWMKEHQKIVEEAPSVLVVGGGALGIQYATDIATVHPTKQVTLLHSRKRLLPRFDEEMHDQILNTLESIDNISVILGERLDLSSIDEEPGKTNDRGQRIVRTVSGREIAADLLLLCTGQTPNTGLLKDLDPATVNPGDSLAHVLRTMQLGVLTPSSASASATDLEDAMIQVSISEKSPAASDNAADDQEEPLQDTPYPHIFVVGDAADAFGAIAAGHNAYYQGEVAARNILRLIKNSENGASEKLERYTPGPPRIKVSLGLGKSIFQSGGIVGRRDSAPDDLDAATMWPLFGIEVKNEEEMYE